MAELFHFIGIGGSGMSGLARLLLGRGEAVSGSDIKESPTVADLRAAGATVHIGHRAENIEGATRVVYTAAVRPDNPELVEARRTGIPAIVRAEMLGQVMEGKRGIAISGTHGKTTTTGIAASVLLAANTDPSILVGGDWGPIGGNARGGGGEYFVAEACEAFNSFLELHPHIAIITNLEADHLDFYGTFEAVIDSFRIFLRQVQPGGYVIGCGDDPNLRALLAEMQLRTVTYGEGADCDYRVIDLDLDRSRPRFRVAKGEEILGEAELGVPGHHNVLNALAVVALAAEEGLPWSAVQEGLAAFTGVGRRFERLGEERGVLVVDDYAHHPTEIAATLAAARRAENRRILAVFQPHLYSRTQLLLNEFAESFGDADHVLVAEIYAAREDPLPDVTGELLAERIADRKTGKVVEFVGDRRALLDRIIQLAQPGDLVLTMGAGDIREIGEALIEHLRTNGE